MIQTYLISYHLVPGPVIDLHPSVIGSNFVELTWTKPELLNSPGEVEMTNSYLLGYDVGFQVGENAH